jgi:DNA-binding beta-propeller fold protein YncE
MFLLLSIFSLQYFLSFGEQQPQERAGKNASSPLMAIYLNELGHTPIGGKPLSRPQGLSIDLDGNLYIADTGNNRVLKVDQEGKLLRQVGGFGWGKEQFDGPVDVWAENGLDVLIVDYNNRRIERYDKDLHYISSLYNDETAPATAQFAFPVAVALSGHGEILLADAEFQRIVRINSFGKLIGSFGDYDAGDGALSSPMKILISPRDEVFIADSARGNIIKYDYFGNFVTHLGDGVLRSPTGIDLWKDVLLVADGGAHQIVGFSRDGERLGAWGEAEDKGGQFSSILGVKVFRDRALVLDGGNNRVQIFELKMVNP